MSGVLVNLTPYEVAAVHPRTGHIVRWQVLASNSADAMLRCDLAGMLALSALPTCMGPSSAGGAGPPAGAGAPPPAPPAA